MQYLIENEEVGMNCNNIVVCNRKNAKRKMKKYKKYAIAKMCRNVIVKVLSQVTVENNCVPPNLILTTFTRVNSQFI